MRIRVGVVTIVALAATASSAQAAGLVARGSVEQVQVTGARHGAKLALLDRHGHARATQRAGTLGGAVFRGVAPGGGYRVRRARRATRPGHRAHDALGAAQHEALRPEDPGERLRLPDHARRHAARGRRPPARAAAGRTRRWSSTRATATPNPAGRESSIAPIANLLGFAVVDVNMRGTGCSGGAFDYFERLQGLDGYDVDRDRRPPAVGRCTTRSG